MARSPWLVVATLIGVASCSAHEIAVGECGNQIAEPGEDCDTRERPEHAGQPVTCAAPGTQNACRYTCSRSGGAACPDGWQCGADNLCRYESGRFAAATPRTAAAGDLRLGDVDGDGENEVIVLSLEEVHPLFGNGDGTFTPGRVVPVVFPTPTPDLGDLDGDGRIDLVTGTLTGFIQFHGHKSRAQIPFPQPAFDNTALGVLRFPLRVATASANPQFPNHHLIALNQAGTFGVGVVDQLSYTLQFPAIALATDHQLDELARLPARGDVDGDGDDEFALVFRGSDKVIVFGPVTTPSSVVASLSQQVVNLPGVADNHGALLVDADGDGERDLVVGIDPAGVAIAHGNGDGTFGPAQIAGLFGALQGSPFPFTPIALGSARGWINDFGVFRDDLGSPTLVDFNSTFAWSEAVVGDFNNDGRDDFAAAVTNRSGIDVLLQTHDHLFAHTRVITAQPPSNLRVGDFDGDGTRDLVFRESAISNVGPYELSASFGSAQGLTAPTSLGSWTDVVVLEPMSIFLSAASFRDGVDDLVVQGVFGDSGKESVTFLFGSSQRIMLAPYEARVGSPATPFAPDVSVIGRFDGDAIPDVALVNLNNGSIEVSIAVGTGGGNLKIPAIALPTSTPIVGALGDPSDSALGFGCSMWLAGDLDGNGFDDLIGLTRDGEACFGARGGRLFVGMVSAGGVAFSELESGLSAPARTIQLADLDGDGLPELLVVGESRATAYFRSGSGVFAPVDVPTDHGVALAIAATNADSDPELEVAIATSDGVVVFDLDGREFANPRIAFEGALPADVRILASDVNGDRLDDLLVHDTQAGELRVLFAIPHDADSP